MASSRLNINGIDVGYNQLLPISTNYVIADLYEVDKRNSAYTKTIKIPATKEINQIFEFAYEINIKTSSFNPNLKIDAKYYVNEIEVFDGSVRLIKVLKNYEDGQFVNAEYECQLIGNTGNLFLTIYDRYLTDIDFSDLDHNFVHSTAHLDPLSQSPRPSYFYPFIDYGFGGNFGYAAGAPSSYYEFTNLKPAIFEDVYWDRIFSDAGYTYESSLIGAASYHKKIFIPNNSATKLQLSSSDLADNQIYVGRTSNTSGNFAGSYIGGSPAYWRYLPLQTIPNNIDNASGFNDAGNNYNTGTYVFTQAITGYYNLNAVLNFTISLNIGSLGSVPTNISGYGNIYVDIQRSTDGGATWTSILSNFVTPTITSVTTSGIASVNIPGTLFTATTQWRAITNSSVYVNYKRFGIDITTGSTTCDFFFNSGCSFSAQLASSELQYGNSVDMNSAVPEDIRQIDLITSIIKRENLYLDVDKEDNKNYIVETREDFIDETDYEDWTSKVDVGRDIEIAPLGKLDFKKYILTYKSDEDYYNKKYFDKYKEVYGTQTVNVESDFNTSTKTIDLIFSATPIAQGDSNNKVMPRLFQIEDGIKVPMKTNIRCLIQGGLLNSSGLIAFNGTTVYYPALPYCGMVDDPITPTVDLCMGTPKELYWNLAGQTYPNTSRYNVRWSKFIEEITDRDSKLVTVYAALNEIDIKNFSFRKLILIENTYYLVNSIEDYDPQSSKPCKLVLLKYLAGASIAPVSQTLVGAGGSLPNGSDFNFSGNYGQNTGGLNNINYNQNTFVFGENITVSP